MAKRCLLGLCLSFTFFISPVVVAFWASGGTAIQMSGCVWVSPIAMLDWLHICYTLKYVIWHFFFFSFIVKHFIIFILFFLTFFIWTIFLASNICVWPHAQLLSPVKRFEKHFGCGFICSKHGSRYSFWAIPRTLVFLTTCIFRPKIVYLLLL